mgnify:FL=1
MRSRWSYQVSGKEEQDADVGDDAEALNVAVRGLEALAGAHVLGRLDPAQDDFVREQGRVSRSTLQMVDLGRQEHRVRARSTDAAIDELARMSTATRAQQHARTGAKTLARARSWCVDTAGAQGSRS